MSFRIYLSPPDVGAKERAALLQAFDSGWIAPAGPDLQAFETEMEEFLGGKDHVVATSSGTAALHLALLMAGVSPGDEVLCPTLTFVATANAIRYVGAIPVFVDSQEDTWNIDPDLVRSELDEALRRGKAPAAVLTVDLYGQCADHEPIIAGAREAGVPVIEDAAEALGATYQGRPAGTLADYGIFSFNGNKIITTSGGGMLVTKDSEKAARARYLATQARMPVVHYEHADVGFNYRLSNLLAAIGRAQLRSLSTKVARRREIYASYVQRLGELPGVTFHAEAPTGTATCWLTCLMIDPAVAVTDHGAVRAALGEAGIESRPVWKPMHLQPVFEGFRRIGGQVAERIFETGLALPSGSSLTPSELDEVAAIVESVLS